MDYFIGLDGIPQIPREIDHAFDLRLVDFANAQANGFVDYGVFEEDQ